MKNYKEKFDSVLKVYFAAFKTQDKSSVYTLKFKQIIEGWDFDHKDTNPLRLVPPPIVRSSLKKRRRLAAMRKNTGEDEDDDEEDTVEAEPDSNKNNKNNTDKEQELALSFEKNLKLRRACSVLTEESTMDDRRELVRVSADICS